MAELTEQERAAINERLARVMGYQVVPQDELCWKLVTPTGGEHLHFSDDESAWDFAPDFTRDAAASRSLCDFLRTQEPNIQALFRDLLWIRIEESGIEYADWRDALLILTAPLLIIAIAADAAIGGGNVPEG